MISLSAHDILVAHILVCHSVGKPADLKKPKIVKDIESQLKNNFNWFSPMQAAAYVGLHITKNKPFSYANLATATALALATASLGGYIIKNQLAIEQVSSMLKNSSVVDDVADELLLVCDKK